MLFHQCLGRLIGQPPGDFQLKFCMPFSSTACTCSAHEIILDLVILLFAEYENWYASYLYNFLHRPVISSFLDQNIVLSTLHCPIYILPIGFHF
jgi:hypothetical protein